MKVPRIRIKGDGLYVGRAGISLVGVVLILIGALVVGVEDIWWKGFLVLALIPLIIVYAYFSILVHGGSAVRRCPHCQGRGWVRDDCQNGENYEQVV